MTKKIVLTLLIAAAVVGSLGAQSANVKDNWISGELGLLGAGARYERMITEKVSVGANAYWNSFFIIWNELEIGASVRFYPWGNIFFAGLGVGYHTHTGTYDYEYTFGGTKFTGTWFGMVTGVAFTPEIGWKISMSRNGGFFLEPGVKLPITLGRLESYNAYMDKQFKVGVGFVPYLGLGGSF